MSNVSPPDAIAALSGAMVMRFTIDDSLTLDLRRADGLVARVRIDGALRYRGAGGSDDFDAEVETGIRAVGPLFAHLFERIDRALVADDGTLQLDFGAAALFARPQPHGVAWKVSTADGREAACLEDGHVVFGCVEPA